MPKQDLLTRVRKVALALPDTEESTRLGGEPHFYVRGKIFAGAHVEAGGGTMGVKVGLERQAILITRPGIEVAKYVGRYGWISVAESALSGDAELRDLVELSYELVASKLPGANVSRSAARKKAAKK